MQKLIDNTKIVRQWNDDMKALRVADKPMATKLTLWQRFVRRVMRNRINCSVHGRAIYSNRLHGALRDE